MQRRQRAQLVELGEHGVVDPHRRRELGAAMHHPVADAYQPGLAQLLAQPVAEHAKERGVVHARVLPAPVDQHLAVGVLGMHVRLGADALDLAFERKRRLCRRPDRART